MPVDEVAGLAAQVIVQGATEVAGDKVHRRSGWKGCLAFTVLVAMLIGLIVYLI